MNSHAFLKSMINFKLFYTCFYVQNRYLAGSFLGPNFSRIPRLRTIHVTLGYRDGLFCHLLCYLDWAQYPVCPLYVGLWGYYTIGFVVLIGLKMRQSVVLRGF